MELPIRIIVVDDHAVIRRGIKALVATCDDIEVVADADNAETAMTLVLDLHPDVALVDMRLTPERRATGLELVERIKQTAPTTRVALLTAFVASQDVRNALGTGVDGYILKTTAEEDIAAAIRRIHAGEKYFSRPILAMLMDQFSDNARLQIQAELGLDDPDVRLLDRLSSGATIAQLATELYCSEPTVKRRIRAISTKLGATSRGQLLVEAVKRGIL